MPLCTVPSCETGSGFIMAYFREVSRKPFNFSFVSLRPAFNHRAELWTCCPDRMGLRYLTGGIALRPTVFLWGLPGQYINYERALEIAGGRPLASPDLRDAVRCAALLLPGGGDMEPRRYGQATPPAGGWSQSGTRESCSCWSSSLWRKSLFWEFDRDCRC